MGVVYLLELPVVLDELRALRDVRFRAPQSSVSVLHGSCVEKVEISSLTDRLYTGCDMEESTEGEDISAVVILLLPG